MNDTTQPRRRPRRRIDQPALRLVALHFMLALLANKAFSQATDPPTISIAATVSVESASQFPFPIRVGPSASIPRYSFIRVRGMPPMAALSEGYSIAPGSWAVPLQALADLKITLPAVAEGRVDALVSLVAADGSVLVEARSTIIVNPSRQLASPRPPTSAERRGTPFPTSAEDREQAMKLMQKGDEQLAQGLVAPARLLYERAADLGFAPAAMALAGTYDATILAASPHLRGIGPDAKEAKRWYERARQLEASGADQR